MALVENIQREDLNPIERAQAYRALMDQLGLTQAELATRMGEDRSSIANYLRLLDLTEAVRTLVRDGRLSLGHAKLLAGVADILEQQRLAEAVVAQGLSVRNLETTAPIRIQRQTPAEVSDRFPTPGRSGKIACPPTGIACPGSLQPPRAAAGLILHYSYSRSVRRSS